MRLLSNLRIGARLTISFVVCLAGMAVIGFGGYKIVSNMAGYVNELNNVRIPAIDFIMETDRDFQQLLVAERSMIFSTAGTEQFSGLVEEYETNLAQTEERWNKYKSLITTDEERAIVPEYEAARDEWKVLSRSIVDGRISDTREGRRLAIDLSLGLAAEAFENMRNYLDKLQEINLGLAEAAAVQAEEAYGNTTTLLLIVLSLGIVVSLGLAFLITRSITVPLKLVSSTASEISKGNFSIDEVALTGRNELAALAGEFNLMTSSLKRRQKSSNKWLREILRYLQPDLQM